jgi:hypothetical protein
MHINIALFLTILYTNFAHVIPMKVGIQKHWDGFLLEFIPYFDTGQE